VAGVAAVLLMMAAGLGAQETAAPAALPTAPTALPTAKELLERAERALEEAGDIKAVLRLEVWYPAHYTSDIELYASQAGEERARVATKMDEDRYKSTHVISKGVLWREQDTVGGTIVTKIDIEKVKRELGKEDEAYAALPAMGVNALFEIRGLRRVVDFENVKEEEGEGGKVYVVSGKLAAKFEEGKKGLPAGAAKWYEGASVWMKEDGLPVKVELGQEEKPLMRLEFVSIERNVALPEGVFEYKAPTDAEIIDRTQWAVNELRGE